MDRCHPQSICFDIDGTLCTNTQGDYASAQPFVDRIAKVNALFDEGCRITLFTARGTKTKIDWLLLTQNQLAQWGVRYHDLIFGKPDAEIYIDDRGIQADAWFDSINPANQTKQTSE